MTRWIQTTIAMSFAASALVACAGPATLVPTAPTADVADVQAVVIEPAVVAASLRI